MDGLTATLFLAGVGLLIAGAEALVRGASRLAAGLGVSPLVIGLTVVAWGTSAPELAVSFKSALAGQGDVTLGNVVGSNILNVLLVLGASSLLAPLLVSRRLVVLDVPLMIAASLLAYLMGLDGRIDRLDGGLLFLGAVAYTLFAIWQSRREGGSLPLGSEAARGSRAVRLADLALVLGGLAALAVGARWLVDGAVALAERYGVSQLVVGLTVVAIGTSLPEVATSLVAAWRGQRDIAVGNVVGSNLFNLLAVLGPTACFVPGGVPVPAAALRFDLPVMIATALACLPIFASGHVIARWEGALFLGYYAAYSLFLFLEAGHHAVLPVLSRTMIYFVMPLTAITLAVVAWREVRR